MYVIVNIFNALPKPTYNYWFAFVLCYLLWKLWSKRPSGAPPGTNGIPLIGAISSFRTNIEQVLENWAKIYGPIFMIKMGFTDVVVLSDLKIANELLAKNDKVADRPDDGLPVFRNNIGMLMLKYGQFHQDQRRFGLKTLRELGMGRRSLEPRLIDQANRLCNKIEEYCGLTSPVNSKSNLEPILYDNVSSVISEIIFGHDVTEKNKTLQNLIKKMGEPSKRNYLAGFLMICPYLKHFPVFSSVSKSTIEFGNNMKEVFTKEIEKQMKDYDPEIPRGFADIFINRIKRKESNHGKNAELNLNTDIDDSSFTKEQMIAFVQELYLAGTDTTSTTLSWVLFYLACYPKAQEKLHGELNTVIGEDGTPGIGMKASFPYTMSVLQEVLRLRPPVPLSLPHRAIKSTIASGYHIPKGALVFTNLWAIHHNEDMWIDADTFRPERHLDANGKYIKSGGVVPFGIGRRSCLGQQLAIMEIFLMTVSVFRKFRFSLPSGFKPNMEGESMITLRPQTYEVLIEKRV